MQKEEKKNTSNMLYIIFLIFLYGNFRDVSKYNLQNTVTLIFSSLFEADFDYPQESGFTKYTLLKPFISIN